MSVLSGDRKYFLLAAIAAILLLYFAFFVYMNTELGPGTMYEYYPVQGCELLQGLNMRDPNISLSDNALDNVMIKQGYGASGYQTMSLRQFLGWKCRQDEACERGGSRPGTINDYMSQIIGYCRSARQV